MSETAAKVDLRVTKTHNALKNALFALLEKTPFHKITVNDICKTALVSRATFYMHYEDKYALLRYCLELLRSEIAPADTDDYRSAIRRTVTMAHEKSRMFKNLLLTESNQELAKLFSDSVVRTLSQRLEEEQQRTGGAFPAPVQILSLFLAGGLAHLLIWWMTEEYPISPDEMAGHLITLVENRNNWGAIH